MVREQDTCRYLFNREFGGLSFGQMRCFGE